MYQWANRDGNYDEQRNGVRDLAERGGVPIVEDDGEEVGVARGNHNRPPRPTSDGGDRQQTDRVPGLNGRRHEKEHPEQHGCSLHCWGPSAQYPRHGGRQRDASEDGSEATMNA